MNTRRWYGPVVLGLLAAGGLAWFGAGRSWVTSVVGSGELPGSTIETTGNDVFAGIGGLALVVVAGALAVLAASGWLRRGVGGLITVVAIGGALATFTDSDEAIESALAETVAFTAGDPVAGDGTVWRWLTLLAFLAAATLGVIVARWGAQWPGMSSRYDAPSPRSDTPPATEADLWKALDDGRDPTLE